MDDGPNSLRDELAKIELREHDATTGIKRVQQEYDTWAREVALPALARIAAQIGDGASAVPAIDERGLPIASLFVESSRHPSFFYLLFLSDKTGPDRAFVMKRYVEANSDYHPQISPDRSREVKWPFFSERSSGRKNDAKEITEDDVYRDVSSVYLTFRTRKWPE